MNKDSILHTGTRHIFEVRNISSDLLEKSLNMRALAYLSSIKADLLRDTIFQIDSSKKEVCRARDRLEEKVQERTKELEASVKKLQAVEEELRGTNDKLARRVKDRTAEVSKLSYAVEQSPSSVVITDTKGNIEYVNPKFTQLTGYSLEETVGANPRILKSGKTSPEVYKELWKTITLGNEWCGEFCNKKKDGGLYWESASISPIKNDEGLITNFVAIKEDITDRKHADEQIKASLKEKNALLMEIHHRVRNNLQVISSLFLLHTRHVKDEHSIQVFKDAQNRIRSMAIIHEILYESNHLSNINISLYVSTLADKLFSSYGIGSGKISLKLNIKDVSLKIEQAVPLGLLVNELLSNSLKHAFPFYKSRTVFSDSDQVLPEDKQEEPEIGISLLQAQDNNIKLIVCDNGVGMPKNLDFRTIDSLGLNLVVLIAEDQLKGKVTLDRSIKGTKFQIIFE